MLCRIMNLSVNTGSLLTLAAEHDRLLCLFWFFLSHYTSTAKNDAFPALEFDSAQHES